jgi:Sulfotransferase family
MLRVKIGRLRGMPEPSRIRRRLHIEAFNWTLYALQNAGLMMWRLDMENLMETARRRTGLTNFGDIAFHEPLRRLVNSCENEARLNSIGRLVCREDILQLLCNRLEIQRDLESWPDIAGQSIPAPIFITGLPRSGTTLLHNLLAQDHCEFRAPSTWEVMFPSPPPLAGGENYTRIKRAEANLALFNVLVPEFRKIHPMSARFPQECVAILSHSFLSDQFDTMFNIPTYQSWLERQDMRPAYAYHRQFLQHLQYGGPVRRFVLKAPNHMFSLEALFAIYPDAQIIQTHREPLEVLPSIASLMRVMRSAFSDFVDPVAIGSEMIRFWKETLHGFLNDRKELPAGAVHDVKFTDLVSDPIAVVGKLYRELGHEFTAEAEGRMRSFLLSHPNGRHGNHSYATVSFGLDPVEVHQGFTLYRERFGL